MKTSNYISLALLSLAITTIVSCGSDAPKEKQTSYKTLVVKKSDIIVPLKYSARMNGKEDVTVTPQVSGQLMKICIKEGQQIKAGQTLFIIDDREARLDLEEAQANLTAAIAQEKSSLLEYESNKNLFEKKIVSSYMLNTALNSYNQAKAAVAQARSAVNRAKVNLGFCTIKSPVSGIVGNIPAKLGMQVSPATELTTISGNIDMDASFAITEGELEEIISKDIDKNTYINNLPDVTFVMKNGTEYEHKGRIITLTGNIDKSTGSASCTARFPNPKGALYSGIQGSVIIPYSMKNVIVIPQCAVVRLQDKSLVYKVGKDSCAVSAIITTMDAATGKDFVVTSGLMPGDKIVTEGANNVMEGQKVLFP